MNTDINSDMTTSDMNSEANSDMNSEANSDMNSDTQTQTEPETGTRSEAQPNRARIMVALDGSLRAETVLPHAVAIALATGSILHLVTIAQPPRDFEPGVQLGVKCTHNVWEFDLCGAKHYLASVSRRLYGLGVEVECEALQGDPAETLIEHAELDPEIEMVAMTAYGRNGPSGWPLGSVTEKVLLAGDKPLLVARAEGAICVPLVHTYRRILVPLDGSVLAEQALQLAHSLAVRTGAALLLLSAVLPPEQRGVLATGVRLPVSSQGLGSGGWHHLRLPSAHRPPPEHPHTGTICRNAGCFGPPCRGYQNGVRAGSHRPHSLVDARWISHRVRRCATHSRACSHLPG